MELKLISQQANVMKSLICLFVFTGILSLSNGQEFCQTCSIQEQLSQCKERLQICEEDQNAQKSSSYLDQVCQMVGTSFGGSSGKAALKLTVHNLLKKTRLDKVPLEIGSQRKEVEVIVSISNDDLIALRRFVLNGDGSEKEIQNILDSSIFVQQRKSRFFESVSRFVEHEGFVICQVLCLFSLLALGLWKGVAVWKMTIFLFVGSVAWTWVHMYKVALSKKQATLQRLGDVPQMCLIEKKGWISAISDAFYGVIGVKENKCEAYYEALMVDPLWEVTPLKAITETVSQFVLRPVEMCGGSLGVFFNEIWWLRIP